MLRELFQSLEDQISEMDFQQTLYKIIRLITVWKKDVM